MSKICRVPDPKLIRFLHVTKINKECYSKNENQSTNVAEAECMSKEYYEEKCRSLPLTIMKVVRIRFEMVKELLMDEDIGDNLHIIFLFRDPRSVFNSRMNPKLPFCIHPDCYDPKTHCRDLEGDHTAFWRMKKKYFDQLHFIRFEDFAINPVEETKRIYLELGLKFTDDVESFVREHTSSETKGRASIMKKADSKLVTWANSPHFPFRNVTELTRQCKGIMPTLGYVHCFEKDRASNYHNVIKPYNY